MMSLLPAVACLAAPPEALDAEFLDYLLSCEGKDDDWTMVAGDKLRKKVAAAAAKAPPPPKEQLAAPPSAKTPEKQP